MLQQERKRTPATLSLQFFFSRAKLFPQIAVTHRNRAELAIEEKIGERQSDEQKPLKKKSALTISILLFSEANLFQTFFPSRAE